MSGINTIKSHISLPKQKGRGHQQTDKRSGKTRIVKPMNSSFPNSCHSGDHIAEDHIHTDMTTGNITEPHKTTALERSVVDNCGSVGA